MNDNGYKEESKAAPEITAGEQPHDPRQYPPGYTVEDSAPVRRKAGYGVEEWVFVALSPFLYIILGIMFGWWSWAWVIIPLTAVITYSRDIGKHTLTALSPFIYVLFGIFFGWWAWGWIIIPLSAILLEGVYRKS